VKNPIHKITSRVWEWQGKGAWHFVTISQKDSSEIKNDWHWPRKGFGSIPVNVVVGQTSWQTSIFPEKGGTYLLPLKKSVREAEKIKIGDTIKLQITVIS
jgi:hypothetical protein